MIILLLLWIDSSNGFNYSNMSNVDYLFRPDDIVFRPHASYTPLYDVYAIMPHDVIFYLTLSVISMLCFIWYGVILTGTIILAMPPRNNLIYYIVGIIYLICYFLP